MACVQEGCNFFPFMCGRMGCECMKPHLRHKFIEGIHSDVSKKPELPEEYLKQQKSIDILLEGWIKEL